MMTDEQFEKLPRYARWEIERLRKNEEYAERLRAEAEAGFMQRGVIRQDDGRAITWLVRDDVIELTAQDGLLVVYPRASNTAYVQNRRW